MVTESMVTDRLAGAASPPHRLWQAQDAKTADTGSLGQAIVNRLFSAGLDLALVRSQIPDGPAADRLSHAVSQLDEAIIDLRRLMLAVAGIPARPASPGRGPPGCCS
jgi:hypothetical protein